MQKLLKVAVNQSLLMIQIELLIHLVHNSLLQDEKHQNSGPAKFVFWQQLKFHGPVPTGWKCQNCLSHHTKTIESIYKSMLSDVAGWAADLFSVSFFPVG